MANQKPVNDIRRKVRLQECDRFASARDNKTISNFCPYLYFSTGRGMRNKEYERIKICTRFTTLWPFLLQTALYIEFYLFFAIITYYMQKQFRYIAVSYMHYKIILFLREKELKIIYDFKVSFKFVLIIVEGHLLMSKLSVDS